MTPVGNMGPTCNVPGCNCPPLPNERLCSGHWRLAKGFRRMIEEFSEPELLRFDSPSFDRELRRHVDEWKERAA